MRWKKLHISAKLFIIISIAYGALTLWTKVSDTGDKSLTQKEIKPSYSSVKKENSTLFYSDNPREIQAILFEYKYNNVKNALILRCDSVVGIINSSLPALNNSYSEEDVDKRYALLYKTVEDNISLYRKQSKRKQRKLLRPVVGLDIYIKTKNGHYLYHNIGAENQKKTHNQLTLVAFVKLVSTIEKREINISKIIK